MLYTKRKEKYYRWHIHCIFFSFNSQLYELDSDPQRKEFLDELFVFMQKRGKKNNLLDSVVKHKPKY